MNPIKFRVHEWVDTDKGEAHFGIQAKTNASTPWRHCIKGEEVILYKNKLAAMRVVKQLREKAMNEAGSHDG